MLGHVWEDTWERGNGRQVAGGSWHEQRARLQSLNRINDHVELQLVLCYVAVVLIKGIQRKDCEVRG